MQAFSEKCDIALRYLNKHEQVSWEALTAKTELPKFDAVLLFLKKYKGYIDFTDSHINITDKGKDFITKTSFVEQRDAKSF